MTKVLSEVLESDGVNWDSKVNHVPCMAHVIQLGLGAFMDSLKVKSREKSWALAETDELLNTERGKEKAATSSEDAFFPEASTAAAAFTETASTGNAGTKKKAPAGKPKANMSATARKVVASPKGFNKIIEKVSRTIWHPAKLASHASQP